MVLMVQERGAGRILSTYSVARSAPQDPSTTCTMATSVTTTHAGKMRPPRPKVSLRTNLKADLPSQVPPLTPGTNQKMAQTLRASFSTWEKVREMINTPKDPRAWCPSDVRHWLAWAMGEFSLQGLDLCLFETLGGREVCALGKEAFLARAPPYTGDILWAHLDMLLKDSDKGLSGGDVSGASLTADTGGSSRDTTSAYAMTTSATAAAAAAAAAATITATNVVADFEHFFNSTLNAVAGGVTGCQPNVTLTAVKKSADEPDEETLDLTDKVRGALAKVLDMMLENKAWRHISLPVRLDGMGTLAPATDFALFAFLVSSYCCVPGVAATVGGLVSHQQDAVWIWDARQSGRRSEEQVVDLRVRCKTVK